MSPQTTAIDQPCSVEYELSIQDWIDYSPYKDPKLRGSVNSGMGLLCPILLSLFMAVDTSFLEHAHKHYWSVVDRVVPVVTYAAVFIFLLWICNFDARCKTIERMRFKYGACGWQAVLVRPEFIDVSAGQRITRRRWSEFKGIKVANDVIIASLGYGIATLIPFRAFSSQAEARAFYDVLLKHCLPTSTNNFERQTSRKSDFLETEPKPVMPLLAPPLPNSDVSQSIILQYSITQKDAQKIFPAWKRLRYVIAPFSLVGIIAVTAVSHVFGGASLINLSPMIGLGLVYIMGSWFMADTVIISPWNHSLTPTILTTDYETLQMVTPTIAFSYPVSTLHSVDAIENAVIIAVDRGYKLLVPNTAFASEAEAKGFVKRMQAGIEAGRNEMPRSGRGV